MSELIVDSEMTRAEALAQNPENPCPPEMLDTLELVDVVHFGFDRKRHLGQIVVHESVKGGIKAFFERALEIRFPIEKVIPASDENYRWDDKKMMASNNSSGFNYRLIAGSNTPSLHGRGLAFDINTRLNPYIRYAGKKKIVQPPGTVWDKNVPGTLYTDHPLVRLMEGFGWEWGGSWAPDSGRVDYQHFQKRM